MKHLISEAGLQFTVFTTLLAPTVLEENETVTAPIVSEAPSDKELSMALTHLYKKASNEVKKFNTPSVLKKENC